jgi:uncharacterized membrane protein YfcA
LLDIFIYCLFFGAFSGLCSGLLGVGGGIVIVPFLAWLLPLHGMPVEIKMQTAIATSLATIIVTSIAAIYAQNKRGAIDWKIVKFVTPGIAIGAFFGADLAHYLSTQLLSIIFGSFLLLNGARMALKLTPNPERQLPSALPLGISGSILGMLSTLIGIGGGTFTVPYMLLHNVPMKKAIAFGSTFGLPIAIFGAISFAILGLKNSIPMEGNIGYINIPAFLGISIASVFATMFGVYLAHTIPTATMKKVFAVIMLFVGLKMLLV